MFDKLKNLMEIKKQADRLKQELGNVTEEIQEVKGIRIVITGSQHFKSLEIDPTLLGAENKVQLENDLLKSLNSAVKKSQEIAAQKMKALMPGFPGL